MMVPSKESPGNFTKDNAYVCRNHYDNLPDRAFIAVGIVPVSQLLLGMDVCDEKGYLIAGEDGMTKKSGIFAAGDIRTKKLRQIVTAVADGANAITSVEAFLNHK